MKVDLLKAIQVAKSIWQKNKKINTVISKTDEGYYIIANSKEDIEAGVTNIQGVDVWWVSE